MNDRLQRTLPLSAAALLLLVPYRELLSGAIPAARDLLFYFYPAKAAFAESLRAGLVPWIDRYRWGGVPLLGAPGAAPFDPGNLLFAALPIGAAASAWILLRLLTGLAGFYVFGRRIGLSPWPAAAGALLYSLSGPTVSVAPFLGASAAHSFLSWVAVLALDARRSPSARGAAQLGVVLALIAVSGAPEYLLYAGLVALAVALGRSGDEAPGSRPSFLRTAAALGGSATLAALLAAPAILGGLATIAESSRTAEGGYDLAIAGKGALPAARLAEFFSDGVIADWTRVAYTPELGRYYPYVPSLTPGRIALVFALLGLAVGGAGRFRAAGLSAISILLALGGATPVWAIAARVLPVAGTVRYPERHVLLSGFALSWLAALGLSALERRLTGRAKAGVFLLLLPLILLDREGVARRLIGAEPKEILMLRPSTLASIPAAVRDVSPLRLVARDSLVPIPRFKGQDVGALTREGAESLTPEFPALFGVASLFSPDYDLTLPEEADEWIRLLGTALAEPRPASLRLLVNAGASAVVRSEAPPGGRYATHVEPFVEKVAPWRFASRVVSDPDGRRLFERFLKEGIDPEAAYVREGPPGESRVASGRVLSVVDRGDALTLEVDASGPEESFLMLFRLRIACDEAEMDGKRTPVAPVDFGFAGVRVPPGQHVLRLRPDTRWVKIGLVGTVAGCAVVLALALAPLRRRERAVPAPR
ncbi:MAG: hypothetical protein ACHQPI_02435 [Thermoanaerobaculia bacterium]